MHRFRSASPKAVLWLAATLTAIVLPLAAPAASSAEETTLANPNNYECKGFIQAGQPEEGNEEQQVEYQFYCNGRITGYQIQSELPLSGFSSAPILTYGNGQPTTDQFSCSGEFPGYAVNCVGSSAGPEEIVKGQFSIGSKLCQEPREDPLLTVTYAYLEKEVVTQAISGPFDLGHPRGCPPRKTSAKDRLELEPVQEAKAAKKKAAKKARLKKDKQKHKKSDKLSKKAKAKKSSSRQV